MKKSIKYVNPNENCDIEVTLEDGKAITLTENEVSKISKLLDRYDARKVVEEEIKSRVENGELSKDHLIVKDKGAITPLIDFYLDEKYWQYNEYYNRSDALNNTFERFEKQIGNQQNLDEYLYEDFDKGRYEDMMVEIENDMENDERDDR